MSSIPKPGPDVARGLGCERREHPAGRSRGACLEHGLMEDARLCRRPPPGVHLTDDVFLRHQTPVAAVGTVVAMVTQDEIEAGAAGFWPEGFVTAVLGGDIAVVERHVVHIDIPAGDADRVALFGDDALDERFV